MQKAARKIIALLIGIPVLILGIILIPLPGPGLLVTFAGLFILSLEFEFAAHHKNNVQKQLKSILDNTKEKSSRKK